MRRIFWHRFSCSIRTRQRGPDRHTTTVSNPGVAGQGDTSRTTRAHPSSTSRRCASALGGKRHRGRGGIGCQRGASEPSEHTGAHSDREAQSWGPPQTPQVTEPPTELVRQGQAKGPGWQGHQEPEVWCQMGQAPRREGGFQVSWQCSPARGPMDCTPVQPRRQRGLSEREGPSAREGLGRGVPACCQHQREHAGSWGGGWTATDRR